MLHARHLERMRIQDRGTGRQLLECAIAQIRRDHDFFERRHVRRLA